MVAEAAENKFTKSISSDGKRILYTDEFYAQMNRLLDEGKTALEAYGLCGYDIKKLGKNRANKAAQYAKARKEGKPLNDWRIDNGISIEGIEDATDLTAREAALVREIQILQCALEVEKKSTLKSMERLSQLRRQNQTGTGSKK